MSLPELKSLKQRVLRAGGWNFAGYGIRQVVRLGTNLIMTRLLVPEMFGVMAIALMLTQILGLFSDIGLRQNIVRSTRGDDPAFLDTAWAFQVIRGFVLWLVALGLGIALHFAILAEIFSAKSVYSSPVLPFVIAVSSFSTIINGFRSTKWATAHRRFDQKRIAQIELIAQLAALAVMIVIGAATRSIWALVAGGLVAALVVTVLSHAWMDGHSNRFRWEKNAIRELADFGKWVFISSAVGIVAGSGPTVLLGAWVDAHTLGLYTIATLIVGAIPTGLTRFSTMVSLPALSEIARNEPSRLREVYYRLRVPADLLLLFLMGLLWTAGPFVIDLLYDPRYSAAGGILQILALALFAERFRFAIEIYLAVGIPRYLTMLSLVGLVSVYSLIPLMYYLGGVQGAMWGIALNGLLAVPLIFRFNAELRVVDLRRELAVLAALPFGFLCGFALNLLRG